MAKKTNFDVYAADAQKAFKDQTAQMSQRVEKFADFAKDNADAVIASAAKATESVNEIAAEMLAFAQTSVAISTAAAKDLAKAKDVSEFVEMQSELTKASIERFTNQSKKLNEMTVAAANKCAEPVKARLTVVSDLVKTGVNA